VSECWPAIVRCHVLTQPEPAIAHGPDRISKQAVFGGSMEGQLAYQLVQPTESKGARFGSGGSGGDRIQSKASQRMIASANLRQIYHTAQCGDFINFSCSSTPARRQRDFALHAQHSAACVQLVVVLSCRGHLPSCRTRSWRVLGLRCCDGGEVCTICVI
jgi:hypothetical protein